MFKLYFALLMLLMLSAACSDFTEENLENDTVKLMGPANKISTETQTLTFWWDPVEGASSYRLQVALPTFEGIVNLELDTLLKKSQFEHTLRPGNFEWRVRAENSAYQSEYFYRKLTILKPSDITKQKLVLVSPTKEFKTKANQVEFKWNALSLADEYQFELHLGDWSGENAIDAKVMTETKVVLELKEGKYAWGVLARDKTKKKETAYTYRNIVVDRTAPNSPNLSAPANNSSVKGLKQTLKWNFTENNELSKVKYFVQVFSDKDLKNLISEGKTDVKEKEFTFSKTGSYYWRVKAMDEVGNESEYTSAYHFTISNE